MGTKLPCFHLSGNIPSCKEQLKMMHIYIYSSFATVLETLLSILLLIKSGPEALFGSRFTMTSMSSSSVISVLSIEASASSVSGSLCSTLYPGQFDIAYIG